MKKIWLTACITAGVILMSSNSQAAGATGSGPNPYSDCGIGAAIFPTNGVAAAISNSIWDLGTTAVTSATASPETCSAKHVAAATFIRDTYYTLAEETAVGKGEYLSAALNMFGCTQAQHQVATQSIRSTMSQVVSQDGYADQAFLDRAALFYAAFDKAASQACS
jgi:hypothetical protein